MSKNFWFKMPCNFFKRHDIMILRSLPDGDTIVTCFLILISEAVKHDGYLRFSDELPYTEEDLSVICGLKSNGVSNGVTEPLRNVMRNVMQALRNRGLVTVDENDTIFIPLAQEMVSGKVTDNTNAERQRRYRKNHRAAGDSGCIDSNGKVTALRNGCNGVTRNVTVTESKSKSKSNIQNIEKEIYKERKTEEGEKTTRFRKPTVDEIREYCEERKNGIDAQYFFDYYESRGWIVGKTPMKDYKAAVRTWERNQRERPAEGRAVTPSQVPYMQKEYDWSEMETKEKQDLDDLLNGI